MNVVVVPNFSVTVAVLASGLLHLKAELPNVAPVTLPMATFLGPMRARSGGDRAANRHRQVPGPPGR